MEFKLGFQLLRAPGRYGGVSMAQKIISNNSISKRGKVLQKVQNRVFVTFCLATNMYV